MIIFGLVVANGYPAFTPSVPNRGDQVKSFVVDDTPRLKDAGIKT